MFDAMIPSGLASQTTAWLLTYLLHSTLFLGLAWLAARVARRRQLPALEETVWRFALVAALVTASVQTASGREPLAGRWGLSPKASETAALRAPAAAAERTMERAVVPVHRQQAPVSHPMEAPAPARPFPWAALVAGLWSAVALVFGLRWLSAHVQLHRRLRSRPEVVGGDMHGLLRRLAGEAGLGQSVRLTCSSRLPVPIALGLRRPEICVPPRALAALAAEEQEGLLAHELAHLVRRDPFWLAFSHFLASIFFFQPLNQVARRRLREISELRSDEWAVGQTGRPLSLARCLAEVAGWSFQPLGSLVAPGMADRPSHLAHRIRRLLEDARSPERKVRPLWLAGGMALLLIAVVAAAPGVSAAGSEKASEKVSEPGASASKLAAAEQAPGGAAPKLAVLTDEGPHAEAPHGHASEAEPDLAEPDDLDLDLDLDLDPDLDPHLADLDLDIDPHLDLDLDLDLPQLAELDAKMAALGEHGALSEEEEKAFEQRLDAMNDEIENRLRPQMEELERKLQKQMEEFEKSPAMEKLRAQTKEFSHAHPSQAEIDELRAEAERLSAKGEMTPEERDHLRQQARAMADKYRMSDEERERIRELSHQVREEHERFMKEHGAEIEALRKQMHEQAAAIREEVLRQIESDPKMRALREREKESDKRWEERNKRNKQHEQMQKQRRDEREQRRREHSTSGAAIRDGVRGGVRGGIEDGVRGGVEGAL